MSVYINNEYKTVDEIVCGSPTLDNLKSAVAGGWRVVDSWESFDITNTLNGRTTRRTFLLERQTS